MTEQVAIIRDVGYGLRDVGRPCLWFTTYVSESGAALQVLLGEDAAAVLKDAGVYDVKELEGKPCYVEVDGGLITFKRVWKR